MNATTEEEYGTCEAITSAAISSNTIKSKITIEPSIVHKYDLTITFKDTNAAQNYNQGKKFSGVLGVNEYEKPDFATDSWATIAANVKAGNGGDYNVGDIKEVDLGDLGKHNVRIANTTTPEECSTKGFSQSACGFVLEFEDIITTYYMNPSNATYDGTVYTNGHNIGGWPASAMYTYVNTDLYNVLPTELKSIIIDTTVVSNHGSYDSTNFTSIDKLYLLAPKEIYSGFSSVYDEAKDLTRQLDYYNSVGVTDSSYSGAIKKLGTTASDWWLRSAGATYARFFRVGNSGFWNYFNNPNTIYGVSPAFRIG